MLTLTQRELDSIKKNNYLAEGGEADIANYDNNTVIKIFKDKNPLSGVPIDIKRKETVVNYFINKKFPKNVIGPLDGVYVERKFKAYIMEKLAEDEPVRQLTKSNYLKKNKIFNKDALRYAIIIAKTVQELHKMGYIVGDINDQNFGIVGKNVFAVDTDSYGIEGKIHAVTYTENYADPNAYKPGGVIELTKETDNFALAVLCFYILTHVHPFGGKYAKNKNWKFKERIQNKISVLGPHGVEIRSNTPSWNWMSPQLLEKFKEIFEGNLRENILPYLEELYNNMTYCKKHSGYYYSKFGQCPVCNKNAQMQTAPKKQAPANTSAISIRIVFESDDIDCLFSDKIYMSKDNEIVHIPSGRKVDVKGNSIIEFTKDGRYSLEIKDEKIIVFNFYDQNKFVVDKLYKSKYCMTDDTIYYVDKNKRLKSLKLLRMGTHEKSEAFVYNPIFKIIDEKTRFVVSFYPNKAIAVINNSQNIEFECQDKITEYALKYDEQSKRWLFIYEKSDGSFRTMIFGEKELLKDTDIWSYSASPLSGICLYGNVIYEPGNKEIIGLNIAKNVTKAFPCDVVTESSQLQFVNGGFIITNQDKIYSFGK